MKLENLSTNHQRKTISLVAKTVEGNELLSILLEIRNIVKLQYEKTKIFAQAKIQFDTVEATLEAYTNLSIFL